MLLELAEHVDDAHCAASLYALLIPYRRLPVHAGAVNLGSVER